MIHFCFSFGKKYLFDLFVLHGEPPIAIPSNSVVFSSIVGFCIEKCSVCEKSVSCRSFSPACFYVITQIKAQKRRPCWGCFRRVSNMPSIINSRIIHSYRANMPGKTNHLHSHLFSEVIFPGDKQISSRFCAPSGPMGLPPVVMPHPARIWIISSICPWDNRVFFLR